jgi:hypothetical protein
MSTTDGSWTSPEETIKRLQNGTYLLRGWGSAS